MLSRTPSIPRALSPTSLRPAGREELTLLQQQHFDEELGLKHGLKHKRFLRVRINQIVSISEIENFTFLPAKRKADLWWTPDDFEKFLEVRMNIAKAYQVAAKQLGIDVMQVSSIGAHGDEAYRAMVELKPELADESRRGLGLGRKKQRAKCRECYVTKVLEEQERQEK